VWTSKDGGLRITVPALEQRHLAAIARHARAVEEGAADLGVGAWDELSQWQTPEVEEQWRALRPRTRYRDQPMPIDVLESYLANVDPRAPAVERTEQVPVPRQLDVKMLVMTGLLPDDDRE
jgi:hypothetical protein